MAMATKQILGQFIQTFAFIAGNKETKSPANE